MTRLRLLADDLTGALDSSARFVPLIGAVPVVWSIAEIPDTVAIDTGTRDIDQMAAQNVIATMAPTLVTADIAFKKIDSLLRGHIALELAACLDGFDRCILAPAFPYQGRITRHGRQLAYEAGNWRDTGVDLAGIDPRVQLHDAETDSDLDRVVDAGRALPGRTLWCGTGGLAWALVGRQSVPCPLLPSPILALIGSDHPVAVAQLAAAASRHHTLPHADIDAIAYDLARGAAAASVRVQGAVARICARDMIAAAFLDLLHRIERPGTLIVSGGETLRALCEALGASGLTVDGEIEPGVPTSRLLGGRWNGQRIVSKSGAFGDPACVARLLGIARPGPPSGGARV